MRCHTCDKIGVVAAFAELHHGINEIRHVVLACSFGQEREVLLQNGPVVFLLNVGQFYLKGKTQRQHISVNRLIELLCLYTLLRKLKEHVLIRV